MLNDLFYAVLGMLPWTCALIAALLVLRHFARTTLSARFFRLAWLILAVRLALCRAQGQLISGDIAGVALGSMVNFDAQKLHHIMLSLT